MSEFSAELPLGQHLQRTKDTQLKETRSTGTSFITKDVKNKAQRSLANLWNKLHSSARELSTKDENTKLLTKFLRVR